MSDAGAVCSGGSESLHVIGWFPTELNPSIPMIVLVEEAGRTFALGRDWTERKCPPEVRAKAVAPDIELRRDQWIVVDGEPRPMLQAEMGPWSSRTAAELVQKAMQVKGDPLRVLKMLESAASLRNLDLGSFVSALQTQRTDGDGSLGEVFLRVRNTQAGGRTGG